jgi:hypothetical protein
VFVEGSPNIVGLAPTTTPPSFVRGSNYYKGDFSIPSPLVELATSTYKSAYGSTTYTVFSYGYKAGTSVIDIQSSPVLSQNILQPSVGDLVYNNATGEYLGTIVSLGPEVNGVTPDQYKIPSGVYKIRSATLSQPLAKNIVTSTVTRKQGGSITESTQNANIFRTRNSAGSLLTATNNKTGQVFMTISFKPKEIAAYKVRVTREQSFSSASHIVQDELVFYKLTTRFDRIPIITNKRHTFLEVKIKATNQLNGNIQNLS